MRLLMEVKLVPYGDGAFLPLPEELLQRLDFIAGEQVSVATDQGNTLVVKLASRNH